MRRTIGLGVLVFCAAYAEAPAAQACGGLFCGQPQPLQQQQPVDQTAERILFRVNDNTTTMVVQIAYSGSAPDFAWVLPLGNVPDPGSLAVFPQRGLTMLDANTSLTFVMPVCIAPPAAGNVTPTAAAPSGAGGSGAAAVPPPVTVHYREEVGPYEVAAIESEDPMALYDWLRENDFNVNASMLPYIRTYTAEGMKFLALKLQKDKDSNDIEPLRFDLPGTTPSIPLRITGLAAEPEMSILVFVAGERRYDGANWPAVPIDDDQISWRLNRGSIQTNWDALVARGVDEAGGQGWVTEYAGPLDSLVSNLTFMNFASPEEMEDIDQLLDLIEGAPYVTRLHTRVSAEEMTLDPTFRRVSKGDVSSVRQLSREVEGQNQCPGQAASFDPCIFATCGAGGVCLPVQQSSDSEPVAGCACVEGATARTTIAPPGSYAASASDLPQANVICQDLRMSFSNPGDQGKDGTKALDPCVNFDCGQAGECEAVNMTPTCICDQGYVAIGSIDPDGTRNTTCVKPMVKVPEDFYQQRLPDLPASLPGGRTADVDMDRPVVQPSIDDLKTPTAATNSRVRPAGGRPQNENTRKEPGVTVGRSSAIDEDEDESGCSASRLAIADLHGAGLHAAAVLAWIAARRRRARDARA
jgi:hypothetical protein